MSCERKSESGQVMVLAAGAMLLVIGMAALAVDVGSLYATRRNMQTAADAAAIAGANALETNCGTNAGCTCESQSSCTSAAQDLATFNGFANGTNSISVAVKTPGTPTGGVYVEVDVTQPVPTYFLRALGYSTVSVSTSAIAGYAPTPNCVYIKNPGNVSKTLTVSGGSDINADCGILVESSNGDGMDVSGGSTVAASSIGLVSSTDSGTSSSTVTCGGSTANCPKFPVAATADPLAYLLSEEPTPASTCTQTNYTAPKTTATISPGTYCGGITVPGGATLNLNPGLYIMTGNVGFVVSGGSTVNGTGVTIYNTGSGKVDISGTSTTNLTAPVDSSAGGIPSVLFFQDPANTQKATLSGGSSGNFQGALYFPTTQMLTFSGGSSTNPEDVILDAWEVTISGGSAYLAAPGTTTGGGPPITTARLYK